MSVQTSSVLDVLEFINNFGSCAIKNAIAVVKFEFGEGMDQSFNSRE